MNIDNYSDEIIQSIKSTRDRLTVVNQNILTGNKEYSFIFNERMISDIFGRLDLNSVRGIYNVYERKNTKVNTIEIRKRHTIE